MLYLKKKSKAGEASPRPGLPTWWPALHGLGRQSPAWHHGVTVPSWLALATLLKSGWALNAGGGATKGKQNSPLFLHSPVSCFLGNV